jgi:glycerol-3-phosphate acyltransferase PlsX
MGGDSGPQATVPGAVRAAREAGICVRLVGDRTRIEAELDKLETSGLDVDVVHASQVADMQDKPSEVLRRKKDSSVQAAVRLVKDGEAGGVVSAGNSGATMACGMFVLGRIDGVERPALAGIMPTAKEPVVMIDVGANVDSKPSHLFQFALMADVLAENVLDVEDPRVGLLSIGEEEGKGNVQVKGAYEMLRQSSLNFLGNVEGRDIFGGDVDVVVCDGFVGNVALKLSEGLAMSLGTILKRELAGDWRGRLGAKLAEPNLRRFKRNIDYAEYGGAPLLGLKGIVIVCHGASNAKAIKNAVKMAATFVENKANTDLERMLEANKEFTRHHKAANNGAGGQKPGSA